MVVSKLRLARIEQGVSQYVLALRTGIFQSRISLIENKLVTPTEEEKIKIAYALRRRVSDLFPEEKDEGISRN